MSALIVVPRARSVVIATDTAFAAFGQIPNASQTAPGMAKMAWLPNLAAAIAFRGPIQYPLLVHQCMLVQFGGAEFDELVENLAAICTLARDELLAGCRRAGIPPPPGVGEIVLAGWSKQLHRMEAQLCVNRGLTDPFEAWQLRAPYVAPSDGLVFDEAVPDDGPEAVARLMCAQVEAIRSPECPVLGGRLVYARLTREQMHSEVRDLPAPASGALPGPLVEAGPRVVHRDLAA